MLNRILKLNDIENDSVFLWGARQTGKSTLLTVLFPHAKYYDLLQSDVYARFCRQPSLLRNELNMVDDNTIVIIDEIQKIPELLDEVHWLMTKRNFKFILSGSSARKLRRCGANLLGGRAIRNQLYPLVSAEIPDFNLQHALQNGMLPRHYLVGNATKRLQAYVGDYLREEIKEEALTRNLSVFTHFLEIAAMCDGEMLNYKNIATDCGVSAQTIKEYFSILEETLLGFALPAYTKKVKRRVIQASKFYLFDVGVVNYLTHRKSFEQGSADYGHAFEHFLIQELRAYVDYNEIDLVLSYWRTASGIEVDVVLHDAYSHDAKYAIEIKSCNLVQNHHLKGLRAFREEHPECKLICVSHDPAPRMTDDGIEIWPVLDFLKGLWNNSIIQG